MPNYQEHQCLVCGDLIIAEWPRLCTICEDESPLRKALREVAKADEEQADRVRKQLDDAIAKEGKTSMWQGHKE